MDAESADHELPAVPEPTVIELLAEAESKANADPEEMEEPVEPTRWDET